MGRDVVEALESRGGLGLVIDGCDQCVPGEGEDDRYQVWPSGGVDRGKASDARLLHDLRKVHGIHST